MYNDKWIEVSFLLAWILVILLIAINLIQDYSINDRIEIPNECNAGDVVMYDENNEFACVSFEAWEEVQGVF